ncbi:MAG: chemotaxis protein CheV [Candidatus Thiodiazotropha sp. (ex Lucina aurantia)]|uniref:Chemotaxis protein CheV n=2 Tax=Candidatus Thiodiazotropha TaxID=1913444 RepID=A0A7Z0VJ07_9GAMM|nr:chemotaxis protein CheV [Candidatus Thiodiazotropha endolucinida]MBT3012608.1 chemotaxis protein CheV [Candidatus Thiodiazotropha sp. (ex Lucina pensylvanica)]MBT3017650.1 chemotaxis protein CheV [Candidatus Thiodiazotropha taylori]MBT3039707.1 chemotaxis protein CheV [Candidatus Thiodiazotropha sp. (ex Codakia orbicularis)]MBV2104750.1 chemotaxis protein CheV [Candidatus Thiodiazotropha sp. (ex Lucina aurantia)]MBT3024740.1 chemotaxis protein CheV [Candidatus Thiodiazotropha taylori]
MAGVLDSVDQRTKLAGQNRLELLLFHLQGRQIFGINVFKVKEVVQCPKLTELPGSNPVIRGVASLRGNNIPVMDLSNAIGGPRMDEVTNYFIIITEYNRRQLAFLVASVERIVNTHWEDILPPPKGLGRSSYMTAVTNIDEELVEIIDVEKILSEVLGIDEELTQPVEETGADLSKLKILVVDDSMVARNQIKKVLNEMGIEVVQAKDGSEALSLLQEWSEAGDLNDWLAMVISDIEMPKMDGYSLVTAIREDPKLSDLYVILHSSLSGVFNETMVRKVGADHFLAKFMPDELVGRVTERLKSLA